jgi:hypothetical protein
MLILSIQSCATTNSCVSSFCKLYKPVYYKRCDILHDDVLKAVRKNNATYMEICHE